MAAKGTRQDTFRVTLTLDGDDYGTWQKKTGGKTSGNVTKIKPGGMAPEQSLGGVPTTDTITITRNYDRDRDHAKIGTLKARAGKAVGVLKQQPLDPDGNAYGRPIVWNVTLDGVQEPDVDSESTNSAEISLDLTVNGTPTA